MHTSGIVIEVFCTLFMEMFICIGSRFIYKINITTHAKDVLH